MSPSTRVLADHLPVVISVLTSSRAGPGPHWVMVAEIARFLDRHQIPVTRFELKNAIESEVRVLRLKAQGAPARSVALFEPPEKRL